MTGVSQPTLAPSGRTDAQVIAVVSAAHFVSHYYILMLPPLFVFIRSDFGVSYTELGYALTAFNIVSATLQTPAGFLVDKVGARRVLIAGLCISAGAFAVAGLAGSFWVFVAMFALAGLGNTAYHPADYALLSQQVKSEHATQAYSIHTFAGMLGASVAPATLLFLHYVMGWRGAFVGSAALGLAVAGVLAVLGDDAREQSHRHPTGKRTSAPDSPVGWRLLLSPVILLNFAFFTLLSFINAGLQNYAVVALQALFGTPPAIGNTALTFYLLLAAVGVLIGGWFIGRYAHHALTAMVAIAVAGACAAVIALIDLGAVGLVAMMALAGLASGWVMPSRDMLVRDVTPPGSFGTVFGFITTGFNLAGVVSPIIFGLVMDHANPRAVFLLSAGGCLLAIATVITTGKRAAHSS